MEITITISKETEKKIRSRSEKVGKKMENLVGELVEEVWDDHFPENGEHSVEHKPHSLFRLAGKYSSGTTDTSERMSEILYSQDLDPAQGFGTDK